MDMNKKFLGASLGFLLMGSFAAAAEETIPFGAFAAPSTTVDVAAMTKDGKCLSARLKLIGESSTGIKPEDALQELWVAAVSGSTTDEISTNWPPYAEAVKKALEEMKPTLDRVPEYDLFLREVRPDIIPLAQTVVIRGTELSGSFIVKPRSVCAPS
jgi:hypothetical protein